MTEIVTYVIIGVTVLVSIMAFNNASLYQQLIFNPYTVKHSKQYYRILSHTLLHADWTHLAFNMYTFYSFGTFLEIVFSNPNVFQRFFPDHQFWGIQVGYLYFILLYLVGAVVASLPAMRKHSDNISYNAVGASGAVSAVIMAFMIMFPTLEIRMFFAIPMPAYVGALIFFGIEHYLQRRGGTNVAHDAHIYGALGGIVFIAIIQPSFIVEFFTKIIASWI